MQFEFVKFECGCYGLRSEEKNIILLSCCNGENTCIYDSAKLNHTLLTDREISELCHTLLINNSRMLEAEHALKTIRRLLMH